MITRRRVSLDGVQLDSLDDSIIIQGINVQAGKENINTVSIWGGSGSRVTGMHRDYLDIQVTFSINLQVEWTERAEVFEKVLGWAAGGGWMKINGKPGRRIRVICAQLPAEGDATNRTGEYQITFRAYGVPYWQEDKSNIQTASNVTTGTYAINAGGNAETFLGLQFENTGNGTINTFKATAGSSVIAFENLGLQIGETLVIDHSNNGKRCVLRIRIKNISGSYRSVLDKRTGSSSNDLYMGPGDVTVKIESQRKGSLALSWAGHFL